ncbi:hypothetical protein HED60_22750 [Planctomycetales bacterium ZRK34]|nr:hypothetical protein HED60_22750 [Planctomycetales bacterium ZRK34]
MSRPFTSIRLTVAMVLALGVAAQAAVTVAEFQADFTANDNGHADGSGTGSWTYLSSDTVDPYDIGANLTLLPWDAANSQYGDSDYIPPQVRSTNVHPNASQHVLVRWTNDGPESQFKLDGFFQRENTTAGGNGVDVYVYGAQSLLFSDTLAPATGNPSTPFSQFVTIGTGESVDFLVSALGDLSFDRTNFNATLQLSPGVANGSFETPGLGPDSGTTDMASNGWQEDGGAFGGPGIQTDDKSTSPAAPDGNQWAYFNVNGTDTSTAEGRIWQEVGEVQEDVVYTVDFTLGGRSNQQAVGAFEVALWAGGTAPGGTGSVLIGSQLVTLPAGSDVVAHSVDFLQSDSYAAMTALWLEFTAFAPDGANTGNYQILLDAVDVSVEASPIPAPAALPMGLMLMGGMMTRRRTC